jgi:hypothetical protein
MQRKEDYKEKLNLCHLSSRLRGGRRCGRSSTSAWRRHRSTSTGVEEVGVEVEEAADGVIIDTMPGAYFFAFSKKPSSSKRGRA